MQHKSTVLTLFCLFVWVALSQGCHSARKLTGGVNVQQEQMLGKGATAPPETIYIKDFALDDANFKGDQSVLSRLPIGSRLMNRGGQNDPAAIINNMAEALVAAFKQKNMPAQRLGPYASGLPPKGWLVNGVFTEVDEGNRMQRAVIGFGQGSTQMNVQIGVSDLASANPQAPFIVFGTIKDPSKMPGAAVTLNPYVAAAKFVMEKNASTKDVKATAEQIVAEILSYKQKFIEQKNKMLLDFLSRHEEHMAESLARFEKESRHGILEAWLEYSPGLDVDTVMCKFHLCENPSSDEIIQLALDFDDTLVNLYKEVAEKVNDSKVKEVFKNLLQLEEKEKIQVARAAMMLWEM